MSCSISRSASWRSSLHEVGCTFLGRNCSQSWADFLLWERVFNAHPKLLRLVELGTGEGGFSRFLALQAETRGITFYTFDSVDMGHGLDQFERCDIFAEPGRVATRFRPGATLLFCDDGDKPREVATFAPLLGIGDLVVVHDWGDEIALRDIPSELRMIHEEWCMSISRVFERVQT